MQDNLCWYTLCMRKYALIDRDGTLIKEFGRDERDVAYPPKSAQEVIFMDGAIQGLKQLEQMGYELILATNQSYLGAPRNPLTNYEEVMDYFYSELSRHGITFIFSMICPHGLDDGCSCKKPKTSGMDEFLNKEENKTDLSQSVMFGDRDSDREFAENLGTQFARIDTNGRFIVPGWLT